MRSAYASILVCSLLVQDIPHLQAYNLYGPYLWGPGPQTYYNKWGDIFNAGTPGGTITWSLMPDGTTIDPSFTDPNITGTSSLTSIMNGLGYSEALATIERAFDKWSNATNIDFEKVEDSGGPFNHAESTAPNTGQIRIGAFAFVGGASGLGAVGYAPPPNGGTLEGDILLNSNNTFFFDPGNEGDPIQIFNDFESLLLHEIGHAIGMAHSDVCSVMSVDFNCFQYINRELDPDDIAGIQFLYGSPADGDFDNDDDVDGRDFLIWQRGNSPHSLTAGDLALWRNSYGAGSLSGLVGASVVPEPADAAWSCFVLALLGSYRQIGGGHRSNPRVL